MNSFSCPFGTFSQSEFFFSEYIFTKNIPQASIIQA